MIQEKLSKYNINIDEKEITENLDPYAVLDDMRIINTYLANIEMDLLRSKVAEKRIAGEIYLAMKNSTEKVTDKGVESIINTDPRILEIRDQITELQGIYSYLERIMEILQVKATIINSVMADRRKGISE